MIKRTFVVFRIVVAGERRAGRAYSGFFSSSAGGCASGGGDDAGTSLYAGDAGL